MSAKIDIANMSLRHLGISIEITNFDNERSTSAEACRTFWDLARDKTLRDFDWPFANTIEALALVETDPTVEWGFSYRYPADAVSIRRILNGATRADTESTRVRYSIGRDSAGRIIYSDLDDAEIQYTYKVTDPEQYPPDFVHALSLLLASMIGPSVASDVKFADRALVLYRQAMSEAKTNAANEEPADRAPEAELIRERD